MRRLLCVLGVAAVVSGCAYPADVTIPPAPPVLLPPPMGWNSWNSGMEIDDQSIRDTIDAMVSSGMRDAGYTYVNLDAGWAAPERNSSGELVPPDPQRFPFGLAPLVDYAHERGGLRFGLYSSPFNETCGQGVGTASLGHETVDAATFAAWGGIDFLKYDWCSAAADHDEQVQVFGAMGSACGTAEGASSTASTPTVPGGTLRRYPLRLDRHRGRGPHFWRPGSVVAQCVTHAG